MNPVTRRTAPWIIALSMGLFLATQNPLYSLVPYVVSGWPCVCTAFWLRSSDPVVARGTACFWLYLATAIWKAAASAFAMTLACGAMLAATGELPNQGHLLGTLIVLFTGLGVSWVLALLALVMASREKVRVFVIPDLRELSDADFSAIVDAVGHGRRFNYAIPLLATSIFSPILALGGTLTASALMDPDSVHLGRVVIMVLVMSGIAIRIFINFLDGIIAPTVADCWPELACTTNAVEDQ